MREKGREETAVRHSMPSKECCKESHHLMLTAMSKNSVGEQDAELKCFTRAGFL